MQTLLVVDFLQEFFHRWLGFLQMALFGAVDFLILERLHKTLRHGIVVDISAPTHPDVDNMLLQQGSVIPSCVLDTRVPMVHQVRLRAAGADGAAAGSRRSRNIKTPNQDVASFSRHLPGKGPINLATRSSKSSRLNGLTVPVVTG